jgi:hypothetical protein
MQLRRIIRYRRLLQDKGMTLRKSNLSSVRRRLPFLLSFLVAIYVSSVSCDGFQARISTSKQALLGTNDRQVKSSPLFGSSTDDNQLEITQEEETSVDELDWKKIGEQTKSFWEMASPYYEESIAGRWLFAGMIGLTLLNSGVSVAFSYLGKDFWNALSSKNTVEFYTVLSKYVGALLLGGTYDCAGP